MQHLGLSDPQEVFDINLFQEDPQVFYSVAKDILPSTNKYSPTHAFIRLLQEKGKLLTNFTQNIDNLEGHAGIRPEKLIQCHGSFATASCLECKYKVKGEEIFKDMKAGRVARCDQCIRNIRQSRPGGLKRKRNSSGISRSKRKRENYEDSTDSEDYDVAAAGVMKVFFLHLCQHSGSQRDVLKCTKAGHHLLWRRTSSNVPRPPHKTRPQPCRPRPHYRHFP